MEQTQTSTRPKILQTLLVILWLIACGIMIGALVSGQENLSGFGQLAGIAFILVLMLCLGRSKPNAADFPDVEPSLFPKLRYSKMLLLILGVLAILFLIGIVIHPWIVLVVALTLIAIGIIVKQRQYLSLRLVIVGLIAGGLCLLLSGLSGRLDAYQGFYLACVPILFIGGSLLTEATSFAHVRSVEGSWRLAIKGFLWACVLAFPPALLNVSGGAQADDVWVNQPWEPLVALVPGIAEETWARLFMTTLIYALLRPTTNQRPTRALVAAVLIAALSHGLAHLPGEMLFSPAALQMLMSGILFGVPMGLLFVKRDFEHAVGYHFFVDFARFFVAL